MNWTKAETPPEMVANDCGWISSAKVLVYEVGGEMRVATYEQIDEDIEPRWYSACRSRYGLDRVAYWMPLPEAPNAAKEQEINRLCEELTHYRAVMEQAAKALRYYAKAVPLYGPGNEALAALREALGDEK